jgi:flagellar motility protein MotE (MotC chaperone)
VAPERVVSRRWSWGAGVGTLLAATLLAGARAAQSPGADAESCPTPQGLAELAARLQSRESALARREAALADKEADLRAAEERLQKRLDDLAAVREAIAQQLAEIGADEEQRRKDLVVMLQSVRPKQGAPILAALDVPLAVDVLDRMSPAKAGKLLAALPPRTAAELMETLTEPFEVPQ